MSDDLLTHVYNSVVSSKLLSASPAWLCFTSTPDKQRLEASVRRAIRLGFYTCDDPTPSQLAAGMDDNLFMNTVNNLHHVWHKLLPDKTDHAYNLRSRRLTVINRQG